MTTIIFTAIFFLIGVPLALVAIHALFKRPGEYDGIGRWPKPWIK